MCNSFISLLRIPYARLAKQKGKSVFFKPVSTLKQQEVVAACFSQPKPFKGTGKDHAAAVAAFHLSNCMYQLWPSSQDEDFLLCLFLAWLRDFKSVSIWVFFQSELCLGEPSKVLLLLCEPSRHASSFNTDRNRLAPLRGVLFGLKLEIFRDGMHPNDR